MATEIRESIDVRLVGLAPEQEQLSRGCSARLRGRGRLPLDVGAHRAIVDDPAPLADRPRVDVIRCGQGPDCEIGAQARRPGRIAAAARADPLPRLDLAATAR
jgi:hypothetical protein